MVRLRLLRHRELSDGVLPPDYTHDDAGDRSERDLTVSLAEVRAAAIGLLPYREFSTAELVDRLESRGHGRHLVERAVQQLAEEGLQSDQRFTEVFVRSRLNKGQGPMLIRGELRARGIDELLINEHLTLDESFWIENAHEAALKRFKMLAETREGWAAQARFLARRGFPSSVIYAALGDQHH